MVSSKKAKQLRREEELSALRKKANKRGPDWFVLGTILFVVVFVLGIGSFLVIDSLQKNTFASADASTVTARGTIYDGFFVDSRGLKTPEGMDSSPTEFEDLVFSASEYPAELGNTITLYMDSSCPHCEAFWSQNKEQIKAWLDDGTIDQLYLRPVTFLDNYSLAGANALACTAEYNPTYMLDVYSELESLQTSYGEGTSKARLDAKKIGADLSTLFYKEVGMPETENYTTCLSSAQFANWALSANARVISGPLPFAGFEVQKIEGTPTIFVNGYRYGGEPTATVFAEFVNLAINAPQNSTPEDAIVIDPSTGEMGTDSGVTPEG